MDLEVYETGNGGDILNLKKDLSTIDGFQNMVYLAMFGGNPEQSTPATRPANEQAFDWWGNKVIFPNNPGRQFNSETEITLQKVALNSAGRRDVEQAVKKDLAFMKEFANLEVAVSITGLDKIKIGVEMIQPDNLQRKEFVYIWDATLRELESEELGSRRYVVPQVVWILENGSWSDNGYWIDESNWID